MMQHLSKSRNPNMRRFDYQRYSIPLATIASIAMGVPALGADVSNVEFNRDIRPILADACYHCHGPDKARRKGNLRLDLEADAKATRDGKAAVVPKRLDKSELIRRISAHDAAERMPPANSGRSLSAQ